METKIFLLGGHDLEMQEIANLLTQQGVIFFDRQLKWDTAYLSAYAGELCRYGNQPGVNIYGVELQSDQEEISYSNYHLIDHHNEYSERPSSLEQVSGLLGVTLSRYLLLVDANDSGYIPGLKALGASDREIAEIRHKDRAAQGVSEEDEILAQKAIDINKVLMGDLIIVRALSFCFSPICDRLWPYAKLLVYTDEVLCYYGRGKEYLTGIFRSELLQHKMYHGGGECGYLGTVESRVLPSELIAWKNKIIEFMINY